MPLPDFEADGYLPPGIHPASLPEAIQRFAAGSEARQAQSLLLQEIVAAAVQYPTIKRILLWGSFVTARTEPNDLDYSIVVSVTHPWAQIAEAHRRFLVPIDARIYYGVDQSYLAIPDFPLEKYIELVDFICHRRDGRLIGVVEISLRGAFEEGWT